MVGSVIENPYQIKAGTIFQFAGDTPPSGWLVCDGSNISRTLYKALFKVIGETYGSGDGSTTFSLPDMIHRVAEGGTAGTYKTAGLPNITASVYIRCTSNSGNSSLSNATGAFTVNTASSSVNRLGSGTTENTPKLSFNASQSNSIYGNSTTVQPPALYLTTCIKY